MIVCSIDALIKRTTWKGLIRVLSPQVVHFAILFVLLGYCVSASAGYKKDVPMNMIDAQKVEGFDLKINNMEFFTNPGENSPRWRVYLNINSNEHVLELGRPAFYKRVGFFAKSAQQKKMKAIIGLIYDPGVVWELIGAVTFIIGASGVFYSGLSEKQIPGVEKED
jgi:cytochrome c biogenesis factor